MAEHYDQLIEVHLVRRLHGWQIGDLDSSIDVQLFELLNCELDYFVSCNLQKALLQFLLGCLHPFLWLKFI